MVVNGKGFWQVCIMCLIIGVSVLTGNVSGKAEAAGTASVRTVTRNEGLYDVQYPMVYGLENEAAQELINADIDSYVQKFYEEIEESGSKGKLRFHIYKNAGTTLSLTLTAAKGAADSKAIAKTYGLNYNTQTGRTIELKKYYADDALLNRAQDGLKYVYKIDAQKALLYPNAYYVDKDENIIVIYAAGVVADKSLGEIEVNVTAAEESKVVEIPAKATEENWQEGLITGTEVRIRRDPGLTSPIVGYLEKNEVVRIGKTQNADGIEWCHVERNNGAAGWVAAQYCMKKSQESAAEKYSDKGVILSTDVRMRSEPSTNADILDWFEKDETVEIKERVNASGREWYKVKRSSGTIGWVVADYCQAAN